MAVEACWSCMRRNFLLAHSLRKFTTPRTLSPIFLSRSSNNAVENVMAEETKPGSVSPEVAQILEDSRPKFINNNWHKPKISARRLAELRKAYIAQGFYWPKKPMIDRGLDKTPKGHKYEQEKEERLAKIEENMNNMPRIIEEYRKKMIELRSKRKDERKASNLKAVEAKRMGIHPKDPRGLAAIGQGNKNKKKFQKKV
ncbi:uncharacterized protein LOC5520690 [Nematostella vectensis]|uniref:uncharacterized protein LOC5520690 n=1 Tax=Nematostella vectensis TaxID=45351 RepID=UPI00207754E6|nr:uncharacterized protein LOC5520690 [Nematostella vectensis]